MISYFFYLSLVVHHSIDNNVGKEVNTVVPFCPVLDGTLSPITTINFKSYEGNLSEVIGTVLIEMNQPYCFQRTKCPLYSASCTCAYHWKDFI